MRATICNDDGGEPCPRMLVLKQLSEHAEDKRNETERNGTERNDVKRTLCRQVDDEITLPECEGRRSSATRGGRHPTIRRMDTGNREKARLLRLDERVEARRTRLNKKPYY